MKKIDKQYNELKKRGLTISYNKFKEYYEVTRKANVKMNRLYNFKASNRLLNNRKISINVSFIKNDKDFEKALIARKKIIEKDFIKKDNQKVMKKFEKNFKQMFGRSKKSLKVLNALKNMTLKDLKKFMYENRDLMPLMYYYDQELLEKLDIKLSDVQERIEQFTNPKIKLPSITGGEDVSKLKIKKPKARKKKKNTYIQSLEEIQKEFKKHNPEFFKK